MTIRYASLLPPVTLAALLLSVGCGSPEQRVAPEAAPVDRSDDAGPAAHSATRQQPEGHRRMVAELRRIVRETPDHNSFLGDLDARTKEQRLASLPPETSLGDRWRALLELGLAEIRLGREAEAIAHLESAYQLLPEIPEMPPDWGDLFVFELGLAYLRMGETQNCGMGNAESCILPLRGGGLHTDQTGSRQAIRYFEEALARHPRSGEIFLKSVWLLNLAYMTIGGYPQDVPADYRIPPAVFESSEQIPRFANVAPALGLDDHNLYGGAVVDDFDGDGFLDIFTTTFDTQDTIHFYVNRGDGSFVERTEEAGLIDIYGGINAIQGDYDNDGDLDVYVLRGAWMQTQGRHPNSLIRNNGVDADGVVTFTDVTFDAGLGDVHYPTQTGAWADYDNDGDLDLYVGNEHSRAVRAPSQLFRNDGVGADGQVTFTDVAAAAGVENFRYAKGVVWGDYDGDRWPDLYASAISEPNRLYRNNRDGTFTDVAVDLGVDGPVRSFPVWFWDFDNDGVLDLYVPSYRGDKDAAAQVAASYLGVETSLEPPRLYHGNGRGGFDEVAAERGLTLLTLPMGANFGDLDNDGWLDFYLGTGYPDYEALMPNVMFRNRDGRRFVDVTFAGGFGHLQKGHSIAFADIDGDGDQDVFEQMGGVFPGDRFSNALFENPGFGNHWLTVALEGRETNRAAIGARIRVEVLENDERRSIYKHVSSGGSFGANPLRQTIGLGKATAITVLEIYWPTSDLSQLFDDVEMDQTVRIVEGADSLETLDLPAFRLSG